MIRRDAASAELCVFAMIRTQATGDDAVIPCGPRIGHDHVVLHEVLVGEDRRDAARGSRAAPSRHDDRRRQAADGCGAAGGPVDVAGADVHEVGDEAVRLGSSARMSG
jgi:hypothetical protein